MSEMKPVAWSYYKRYGFKWTLEFTETPLEKGLLRVAQITPLYTAAQLAEAVAAERERCTKVCGKLGSTGKSGYEATAYDPENRGADCAEDMAERIAEAIRSAAK